MKVVQTGISDGGIPLARVEWKDGAWWEVETHLNWGAAKRLRTVIREEVEITSDGDVQGSITSAHDMQELRVIGSTVAWSFKLPVTKSSLERIAHWRTDQILAQLVDMHREATEVITEETKKRFGWLFSLASKFRGSGTRRWRI